jgi:hypothetical protein
MSGTRLRRVGIAIAATGLVLIGLGVTSGPAAAAPVTFTNWTKEGATSAGNWVLSDSDATVTQTLNGAPTFFVSPTDLTENTFTGTITPLSAGADGDYFGVVLGYTDPLGLNSGACDPTDAKCPNDYVLFDWKHDDQAPAQEGMSLIRVNGNFEVNDASANLPCFWVHDDEPQNGCDILDTDFGTDKGWDFDVAYTLRFTYTAALVRVERIVNNQATTLLEATGTFPTGRVGFYNYSQAQVRYTGFNSQQVTQTTTTSTTSTTAAPTTTTTAVATTTTSRPATTTTVASAVLRRTGLDDGSTQLLIGAGLLALGALMVGARGRRPQGRYFT